MRSLACVSSVKESPELRCISTKTFAVHFRVRNMRSTRKNEWNWLSKSALIKCFKENGLVQPSSSFFILTYVCQVVVWPVAFLIYKYCLVKFVFNANKRSLCPFDDSIQMVNAYANFNFCWEKQSFLTSCSAYKIGLRKYKLVPVLLSKIRDWNIFVCHV